MVDAPAGLELNPQDDLYVVELINMPEQTERGLKLAPQQSNGMPLDRFLGRVVERGPGARNPRDPMGPFLPMKANIGDLVIFAQVMPIDLRRGKNKLAFVTDRNVMCVPKGLKPEDLRADGGGGLVLPSPDHVQIVRDMPTNN